MKQLCVFVSCWSSHKWRNTAPVFRHTARTMDLYHIRIVAGCAGAGNAGNVLPRHREQWKPLVSVSRMHHGTCDTHVPLCMSRSLTCGGSENVLVFPAQAQPASLRIWQEAHGKQLSIVCWQWLTTNEFLKYLEAPIGIIFISSLTFISPSDICWLA